MAIGDKKFIELEYARMLMKLFPPGTAFDRREGTDLFAFNRGLAEELERIDSRINTLVKEADPTGANELIGEWEKDLGFPDSCFGIPLTLPERVTQIKNRNIFPVYISTAFSSVGDTTKDSNKIINIADTKLAVVNDLIENPLGFEAGKWKIIDRTATTLILEATAKKTTVASAINGFFNEGEPTKRFFLALALQLGYTSLTCTFFDAFQLGVASNGFSETGDTTVSSDELTNMSSISGIEKGDFVSVGKGFGLFPRKVLKKITPDKLQLDITAASSNVGVSVVGYDVQPFGMGDPVGDQYAYGATLKVGLGAAPANNLNLITCFFDKLKPRHVKFLYTT